jgi:DNA-binding transcriptional LysR family regulator
VADLAGERWIASRSVGDEILLGVWPGLPGRPRVVATARDWLVKLELVAAGIGITTIPAVLTAALPAAIASVPVLDGPQETRRLLVAHLPERTDESDLAAVRGALARTATRAGPP